MRHRWSGGRGAPEKTPRRWKHIAREVYWRKTLILAAKKDLEDKQIPNPLALAATDVFVEKAQKFLTRREWFMVITGVVTGIAALVLLVVAARYVLST